MRPETWSRFSMPSGTARVGIKCWTARIVLGIACLTLADSLPAGAAETGAPNVIVHQDILNNLDWAAAAAARIRGAAGATAALGATVKQPPAAPPVSRVLIEPERIARPSPPTRKPTVIAELPESPAPPQIEAAPEASVEGASPSIETAEETLSIQEAATPTEVAPTEVAPEAPLATTESPPAIPAPPEPTEPASAAIDPIVAPSPPEPQPALPETVLLAEAAPEPEPEPQLEPQAETPKVESEPVKEPKPGKVQTAALPPAALEAGEVRLLFPEGSVDLTESAKEKLGALAQLLQQQAETDRRIQLQAFASSSATNTSVARRLSLARALAVRTFLIEKGVRSRRIDVRALGAKSDEGPPDRVDILDARG